MKLLDDIRNHLAVMNVGQRERRTAVLLREAAAEIERLQQAIRRLAEQDATLSVCDGNVTVTIDATLTDAERFVLREVRDAYADRDEVKANEIAAVIDWLLERTR